MGIESIGNIISKLRKEKGATQEELAKHTLVSTQAVSKWENGGVPDTELLPKIADFFGISIDALFGRSITDYSDIEHAVAKKIIDTPMDERFHMAHEICWVIQHALFGQDKIKDHLKDVQEYLGDNEFRRSTFRNDNGFTLMELSRNLPYFLLVPDSNDPNLAFFEGIDYITFFKDLFDKTVFDAMIFLNKRERKKSFTPNLLIKNLNIELEKAMDIIKILTKYNFLSTTQIEMDDTVQDVYTFHPRPSFIALLIFAREMIGGTNVYSFYTDNRDKPFLY